MAPQLAYLNKGQPSLFKDTLGDVFLDTLQRLTVEVSSLRSKLCQKPNLLLVSNLLLQEYLLCLREHNVDQALDCISAEVRGRRMEEVFVNVRKHARRGLEGVVGSLEGRVVGSVLEGSMAGEDGGDIEDNRGLFKG